MEDIRKCCMDSYGPWKVTARGITRIIIPRTSSDNQFIIRFVPDKCNYKPQSFLEAAAYLIEKTLTDIQNMSDREIYVLECKLCVQTFTGVMESRNLPRVNMSEVMMKLAQPFRDNIKKSCYFDIFCTITNNTNL